MLVTSLGALADTHRVPDGGGGYWGAAYGGYDAVEGTSCSATASANGDCVDSGAVFYATVTVYTEFGGWFYVSWDCTASAEASFTDQDHSGAYGGGGGDAEAYGYVANMNKEGDSGGEVRSWADGDTDPGWAGESQEARWFDAFTGVGASCSCGARASVGDPNGPNTAHGHGEAYADVGLNAF
jgi:hypothetical protein